MDRTYRIKFKDGLIRGPLTVSQIEDMIYDQSLTGEELISEYPEGSWNEIGSSDHFYDVFIGAMEAEKKGKKRSKDTFVADSTIAQKNENDKKQEGIDLNKTVVVNNNKTSNSKSNNEQKTELYSEGDLRDVSTDVQKIEKKSENIDGEEKSPIIPNAVIIPLEEKVKKSNNKPLFIFLFVVVIALVLYFQKDEIMQDFSSSDSVNINIKGLSLKKEFVEVVIPPASSEQISPDESKKKKQEALKIIFKDDLVSYKKALSLLLEAIDLDTTNKTNLSYLVHCYNALFNVSKRDNEYINSVGAILNRAQEGDLDVQAVTLADMGYSVVKKDYKAAINRFKELLGMNQQIRPEVLIKATEAFIGMSDYQTAYQVIKKVNDTGHDAYPRSYYLEALIKIQNKEYAEAEKILKGLLKLHPHHIDSRVKLVELEYLKTSRIPTDLPELLKKHSEDLTHENVSNLLFVLGKYYEKKNNGVLAKDFFQNALSFWSSNEQLLVAYEQLGGDISKFMQKDIVKNTMGDDSSIFMMRGDELYQTQKYRDASMQYRMAVSLDEKNEIAWVKLGESYRKTYEYQKAIDSYISALKINKLSVNAHIKLARVQIELFNFVEALKHLKSAQDISPENPDVLFTMGYLNDKRGLEKTAVEYYHRAVANDFSHVDSLFELAKKNYKYQRLEDAKLIFEKIIAAQPDHFESYIYIGRIIAVLDNIEKANLFFANQEKVFPKSAEIVTGSALAYMDRSELQVAEKELNKALELNKYSLITLMTLADLSLKYGRNKEALNFWETVSIIAPCYLEAIQNKAKLYCSLGDYKSCEQELMRLVTITPFFPRAYYKLADLYFRAGKTKSAEEALLLEIEHNPAIRDSYLLLGDIYNIESQFGKSIELFRKLLRENPKDPYGLLGFAKSCFMQKDYVCAETFVTQARQINPDISDIYLLECQLYFQIERFPAAANSCEIFVKREPNHAFASVASQILSKIRK